MLKLKFILSFLVLFFIIAYLNEINKNSLIKNELDEATKVLQTNFDTTNSHNTIDAKSINLTMKENKKILQIISKAIDANKEDRDILRDELYKLLFTKYQAMRERGILQFQFVFADNISFLRMHKPSKYGDYLGDIRYSFKNTNKTQEPSFGFEQGRTSHAFRNVFPLVYKGKYLGCYEVSFTSESIQNNLTDIQKVHSHFLVNKNIFNSKTWKRKYLVLSYIQSIEDEEYMFTITDDLDRTRLSYAKRNIIDPNIELIKNSMDKSKKFAFYQELGNKVKIVAFLPIQNIKNKKTLAYIVSYTDSKHILHILSTYKLINYISFLTIILILFLLYKTIRSKESLKEELRHQADEIIKKDKIVQEQSKLAAMGEMVGSIAHQWRQPLNSLNINIENLDDDYADGLIDAEFIDSFITKQTKTIQFMSHTIDDFRNFFRVEKIKKIFSVKKAIESILSIQNAQFKNFNIIVELQGEDFKLNSIESEFKHTMLNIISNSKDAIVKSNNPYGKIKIILKDNTITIRDNAGGIPPEILSRIFEPYFTTKEQGEGTGMGLYMSKIIIEQNIGGTLKARNIDGGAEFIVTFKNVL